MVKLWAWAAGTAMIVATNRTAKARATAPLRKLKASIEAAPCCCSDIVILLDWLSIHAGAGKGSCPRGLRARRTAPPIRRGATVALSHRPVNLISDYGPTN